MSLVAGVVAEQLDALDAQLGLNARTAAISSPSHPAL
jgi:hypothetical protein